jgi:hypothetical protein
MGDGPGYDYLADRTSAAQRRKRKSQKRRIELLHQMLREVGFGDTDGDNSIVEKEIAASFSRNFEILIMLTRENGNA